MNALHRRAVHYVCPVDCFYTTEDGVVLHDKDLCIGCGYCLYACPFSAPQYPQQHAFGARGKMDKCTFCAGDMVSDIYRERVMKRGGRHSGVGGVAPERGGGIILHCTTRLRQPNP